MRLERVCNESTMASKEHECKIRIDAQKSCALGWLQTAGHVKPCWLARQSSSLLLVVGGSHNEEWPNRGKTANNLR